jgi:hypothetical protein
MTAPAGVRSQAPELGTDEGSPRREEQRSMIKDADRSVGATISHRVCQEQRTRVHRATQSVVRQRTSCTVFRRSIPDEKRFFPGISVPVLTRRADCSLVALNPAHSSRLLPALSVWFSMTFVRRTTTNSSTSSLRISWEYPSVRSTGALGRLARRD